MFPPLSHPEAARLKQRSAPFRGEQQMLAISRALMGSPRILLDEPSLGLAPIVVDTLMETILQIRDGDDGAARGAERHPGAGNQRQGLHPGRSTKSGSGPELAGDPEIIRAYLGAEIAPERENAAGGFSWRSLSLKSSGPSRKEPKILLHPLLSLSGIFSAVL